MQNTSPQRPGQPPRFTLDQVLDAAARLPHDQLTMTALSKELGVVTSALYRYVRDRDDLVDKLTKRIAAHLPVPDDSQPWDDWLLATALGVFDLVLAHPVISDVRSWVTLAPPEGSLMIEARDRVLLGAGLTQGDAVVAYAAATNLAMTYAANLIASRDLSDVLIERGRAEPAEVDVRNALAAAVEMLLDGVRSRVDGDERQRTETHREDSQ